MFGFGGPQGPVENSKYYDVLGIDKNASEKDIKRAFRKAAAKHHPDRGGDPELFKEINKANTILSDPETREIYDQYGEEGLEKGMGGGGGMGADIFSQMFGGGGQRRPRGPQKGDNVQFKSKVTLEQFYNGFAKPLRLTRKVLCTECKGKGGDASRIKTCSSCSGRGIRVQMRQVGPGMVQQVQTACGACNQTGQTMPADAECKPCKGKGVTKVKETLDLHIDPGMADQHRIKFQEKGDEGLNIIPGDIMVILEQTPHAKFERRDADLFMTQDISLVEALTGFEFYIQHLDERVLCVKSKAGRVYKPNEVLKVEMEGMPMHRNPYVKGSLFIKFNVVFPATMAETNFPALKSTLPGPLNTGCPYDTSKGKVQNVTPEEFDERVENQRREQMRQRTAHEAHEEDDYDQGHQHGAQECRTQ